MGLDENTNQLCLLLETRRDVDQLASFLEKLRKTCTYADDGFNVADVLASASNMQSLETIFKEHLSAGKEFLLRLALENHQYRSLNAPQPIRNFDPIVEETQKWDDMDLVVTCFSLGNFMAVNPKKADHWERVYEIEEGSLVGLYAKGTNSYSTEETWEWKALKKLASIFKRSGLSEEKEIKRTETQWIHRYTIVVNKLDTVVHAGNATLILRDLAEYSGKVKMFVNRGELKEIGLDCDTIWLETISNGEEVVFLFYGKRPEEDYMIRLAQDLNKYTQMDKWA